MNIGAAFIDGIISLLIRSVHALFGSYANDVLLLFAMISSADMR
jgi:hypothetical protein